MTKLDLRRKAELFRKNGMSIKQIAQELKVSSSTASVWVRDVVITREGRAKIAQRTNNARIVSAQVLRNRKEQRVAKDIYAASQLSKQAALSIGNKYLLAALIYECEGGKSIKSSMEFTNSDPDLIRVFLKLLRVTFPINESKFRVVMHLHSYHDEKAERRFWSKVMNIQEKQFLKTYQKAKSGNIKLGYKGCVQIKYFDVTIKRTLLAGKALLAEKLGL